jgi:hypothetical protein
MAEGEKGMRKRKCEKDGRLGYLKKGEEKYTLKEKIGRNKGGKWKGKIGSRERKGK